MSNHLPGESETPTKKRVVTLPPSPLAQERPPQSAQDTIPHRQIWGGVVALIAAMLLIILFPRTLHTPTVATTTASATATHAAPTATTIPTPIPAGQAWGAQAVTHQALTLPDGSIFVPTDSAPDGSSLAGYTTSASGGGPYSIVSIALPGFTPRKILTLKPDEPIPAVRTDGQFVAWIGGANAGGTQKQIHQTIGYAKITSGFYVVLYDTYTLRYNPGVIALDDGRFYYSLTSTPTELTMMDLTTSNTQRIAPQLTFAFDQAPGIQVNGANMEYFEADNSTHVFNLQTQQDTPVSEIQTGDMQPPPQLSDDGVYWAHTTASGTTLERWPLDSAMGAPDIVITIPVVANLKQLAVNDRLIVWNDGANLTAWDRAKNTLVGLHAAPTQDGATLAARGTLLWYLTDDDNAPGIDIIDTGRLG